MIKINIVLILVAVTLIQIAAYSQSKMVYGSNKGKYIKISGKNVYYEEYGRGVPLLLLEGGMKTIADFSKCIPELSKHFRVIAPDDPGQGRSEMQDTMTYSLLADYVSRFIDELKLDSVYVMGWSDGGIAALILAAKRPDKVKKVIASGANYMKSGLISSDSSKDTLQLIPSDYKLGPEEQKEVDKIFILNKTSWTKIYNDRAVMWFQEYYFPESLLGDIKIPVMIVSGDHDVIKLEHSIKMYRLIKGSQLYILPNTTHDVFNDSPELINEVAIKFFTK
ncbi:MAG: alpha/beta hydrolase [Bacteroidetes bacterium]|nr:alpha/beta hydrolase [Bacteroidota bacterium]